MYHNYTDLFLFSTHKKFPFSTSFDRIFEIIRFLPQYLFAFNKTTALVQLGQNHATLRSLINVQSLITVQGVTLFYKKFKVNSGLGLFLFLRP